MYHSINDVKVKDGSSLGFADVGPWTRPAGDQSAQGGPRICIFVTDGVDRPSRTPRTGAGAGAGASAEGLDVRRSGPCLP